MKQLILVRHAKSDWNDASLNDFDRPLNERGKHDAPMMARRLLDRNVQIDLFVSSAAKRARKTAFIFAKTYKREKEEVVLKDELYLAEPTAFYDVLANIDDTIKTVALFAHNPGITDFANQLSHVSIDNIPTAGVFAVKIDCNKWSDFIKAEKEFWFFDYPSLNTGIVSE